jgi:hypothetical protein
MKRILQIFVLFASGQLLAQAPPAEIGTPSIISPMLAAGSFNTPNIVEASCTIEGMLKSNGGHDS